MKKFKKALAAFLAAAACLTAVPVSAAAEAPEHFAEITESFETLTKNQGIIIDGDYVFMTYFVDSIMLGRMKQKHVEWTIGGTADTECRTGFVEDEHYDFAVAYCEIKALSEGTVSVCGNVVYDETGEPYRKTDAVRKVFFVDENCIFSDKTRDGDNILTSVLGDVNNDGEFTVADIVMLEQVLIGRLNMDNVYDQNVADLCKDGKLDVYDLVMLRKALLNVDELKPVEFSYVNKHGWGTWDPSSVNIVYNDAASFAENENAAEYPEYDDDFFAENTLIYVRHQTYSGSFIETIKSVSDAGNGVYVVNLNIFQPELLTCDMMTWEHFITVPKAEISEVKIDLTNEYAGYDSLYD